MLDVFCLFLVCGDLMGFVDIILATYNGDKYLQSQLDSIISQTHQNWRLLISDDGSDDGTLDMLRKFEALDSRISLINNDRQGGVVNNFLCALRFAEAPYIMFCDQDDIWLPDKISNMLAEIEIKERASPSNTPILVFSDLCLVDADGVTIDSSYYSSNKLNPENNRSFKYLAWRSTVYGCSVIFNKSLFDVSMPMPRNVPMHDHWFALNAAVFGQIFYFNQATLKYRQHSSNVVGGKKKNSWQKINNLRTLVKNVRVAAFCVTVQWGHIMERQPILIENQEFPSIIDSYFSRLRFLLLMVRPYWQEKKMYALLFCFYFMFQRLPIERTSV